MISRRTYCFVLKILALIGVIFLLVITFRFVRRKHEVSTYDSNCHHVKVGMTVDEAKEIMGDNRPWEKQTSSRIHIYRHDDPTLRYCLSYPGWIGSSDWTQIYFDPTTMLVTKIHCSTD